MTMRAAVLSILVCATEATAQSQVNGHVQGDGAIPLGGVHITLRDSTGAHQYEAISDRAGNFIMTIGRGLTPGLFVLKAEMLGYATIDSAEMHVAHDQTVSLVVEMDVAALRLRPVNVVGEKGPEFLSEFHIRAEQVKHGGAGYIVDRPELARAGNLSVGRVLAGVPGLRFVPPRRGNAETVNSTRGNCQPKFFLDGTPMVVGDISSIMASTLEGVEVYNGPGEGPVEYFDRTGCGVVLMWSRRGERGTTKGYPVIGLTVVAATIATLLLLKK